MAKTYLVGNWKSNKTKKEATSWIEQVQNHSLKPNSKLEIVLCLPFIHLVSRRKKFPPIKLGVQNLSAYPDGAYTGEVSARMLEGLVDYALLGHSERRHYFHEASSAVALKVTQALEHHITPIVSISLKTWQRQLNQFSASQKEKIIFMYEPPEAISRQVGPIGKGQAAPISEVVKMIAKIKRLAPQSPVLYGGSVKSHNLADFLNQSSIDGVVPGSASLSAKEWLKMLTIFQQNRG